MVIGLHNVDHSSTSRSRNDVRTLETIIALDPGQPEVRIGQRMRVVLTGETVKPVQVQARR